LQDRKWALARFFFCREGRVMNSLQDDIEARLAVTAPEVEVLLAEVVGGETLERLAIAGHAVVGVCPETDQVVIYRQTITARLLPAAALKNLIGAVRNPAGCSPHM
jgi:hypothetical protein